MSRSRLSLTFIVALAVSQLHAQQTPRDDYILRPGDTIAITVWDTPEYTVPLVEVRPDGKVTHPFAGEVPAAGRTATQLADDIRKALLKEIRDPLVSVMVVGFKQDWLFVTGAVRAPGAFPIKEELTIQQALAWAGGPAPEADLARVAVIDRAGKHAELDLSPDRTDGPDPRETKLGLGCTVIVPERLPENVAVLGAVTAPGIFQIPINQRLRVSDAVALAGGFTELADPEAASFVRSGAETSKVDLTAILHDLDSPANTDLQHGDAIIVPEGEPVVVAVLGAVKLPGVYPLKKKARLSEAIALAGGPLPEAQPGATKLMRADGTVLALDLQALLAGSNSGSDMALQTGDTIIVPSLAERQVAVLGAVADAGRFTLAQVSHVADLIALAQPTPEADRRATLVRADGSSLPIDLDEAVRDKAGEGNVALQDGDALIIEDATRTVAVLGAVQAPGHHEFKPGVRFSDAIAKAGGLSDNARVRTATVMRKGTGPFAVDLDKVLTDANAEANIPLEDGDTIIIQAGPVQEAGVLGAVSKQGKIVLDEGDRVSDAIAKAGGLNRRADRETATIMRADGTVAEVDLEGILVRRDNQADIPLLLGDTLVIAEAITGHAGIMGAVARPGLVEVTRDYRVSDLLAQVGGPSEDADLGQAILKRADSTRVQIDLAEILGNADTNANLTVSNGDTLYVPNVNVGYVAVLGEVNSPGRHRIGRDERVSAVIARAQGPSQQASYSDALIMRPDGTAVDLDLRAALENPGTPDDPVLHDGETLMVRQLDPITVLGAVGHPGVLSLQPGARASTAVARSGGVRSNADLPNTTVMHEDGSSDPLDLERVLVYGDQASDVALRPGDVIVVPEADDYVSLIGAVNAPGRHPIARGARLTDAIAAAKGLRSEAERKQCVLLRGTTRITVELGKIVTDKNSDANIEIKDGDTIIVDAVEPMVVSVLGQARREAQLELDEGAKVSDAIAAAGGLTEEADAAKVKLIRGDTRRIVDLAPLLHGDELTQDPELQHGDLVVIPESTHIVSVMGVVKKPGIYRFKPGERLLDAVNRGAGSWAHGKSAPNRTVLTRTIEGQQRWTKVDLLVATRDPMGENNPVLKDGDIIYIPAVSTRTMMNLVKSVFPVASFLELFNIIQ